MKRRLFPFLGSLLVGIAHQWAVMGGTAVPDRLLAGTGEGLVLGVVAAWAVPALLDRLR